MDGGRFVGTGDDLLLETPAPKENELVLVVGLAWFCGEDGLGGAPKEKLDGSIFGGSLALGVGFRP